MKHKKSIRKNYIYNLLYQILVIIIPIITIPYISRVLGARNIGIYGYTLSISAYFILAGSLGIALYGQREIAYVQNNKSKYSKTFWEILLLKIISMTISTIIFYFLFVKGNNDYTIYYKILLLELLGNAIDINWFFQGLEEFGKTVFRNLIIRIISLICIFIFVKTKNDLIIYFIIYVISIILGNLSLWMYIPKYIKKVDFRKLEILKHIKPTLVLFIPQAAIQIYTVLDRTMIGTIIPEKAEVGFYTQGEKIIKLLLTIITAMGTVMLPRIANRFAKQDNKAINIYINKSFNLVFFLAFPLTFGIIAVANGFVPLFFGPGYDKVISIMMILSPIIIIIGMSNVIGMQYLLPTKKQKEFTISVICGSIVNFTINLFLIRLYGAIGAAIATVIAELTVTTIQINYVKTIFNFKKIINISKNYFIAALVMYLTCYIVSLGVENSISSILYQVAIGAITYLGLLYILKDKFFIEVKDTIIRVLSRIIK